MKASVTGSRADWKAKTKATSALAMLSLKPVKVAFAVGRPYSLGSNALSQAEPPASAAAEVKCSSCDGLARFAEFLPDTLGIELM